MRTIYTFLFSLSALTLSAAQPVSGEPALLSPCSIGLRADNVSVGSRGESIDLNSHKWVFHGYLRQSDNSLLIYNAPGKLTVMGEAQKEINGEIMTVQEVEIADMFSRVLVSSDNEYIKVDPFTAYFNASTECFSQQTAACQCGTNDFLQLAILSLMTVQKQRLHPKAVTCLSRPATISHLSVSG